VLLRGGGRVRPLAYPGGGALRGRWGWLAGGCREWGGRCRVPGCLHMGGNVSGCGVEAGAGAGAGAGTQGAQGQWEEKGRARAAWLSCLACTWGCPTGLSDPHGVSGCHHKAYPAWAPVTVRKPGGSGSYAWDVGFAAVCLRRGWGGAGEVFALTDCPLPPAFQCLYALHFLLCNLSLAPVLRAEYWCSFGAQCSHPLTSEGAPRHSELRQDSSRSLTPPSPSHPQRAEATGAAPGPPCARQLVGRLHDDQGWRESRGVMAVQAGRGRISSLARRGFGLGSRAPRGGQSRHLAVFTFQGFTGTVTGFKGRVQVL